MAREAVSNEEVEQCLRALLVAEGYEMNPPRAYGEIGTDVIAERDGDAWHIEVIGYKKHGPARAKDFFEVFFRSVSRLNDSRVKHCVIAVAKQAEAGLPARASHHRVAWQRIATAFPELKLWLVDVDNRSYERTSWGDWLK